MTALQKKENKFLCMTKCKEIFQKLKQLLMTASILQIVDPIGDFIVCTDARKEGLGGVLLQNDHTIFYESRNLKENEHKCPMHPMTALLKKASKFLWTAKCEEIFQNLKQLLMIAPMLQIADPDGDFVVCMDERKDLEESSCQMIMTYVMNCRN